MLFLEGWDWGGEGGCMYIDDTVRMCVRSTMVLLLQFL